MSGNRSGAYFLDDDFEKGALFVRQKSTLFGSIFFQIPRRSSEYSFFVTGVSILLGTKT